MFNHLNEFKYICIIYFLFIPISADGKQISSQINMCSRSIILQEQLHQIPKGLLHIIFNLENRKHSKQINNSGNRAWGVSFKDFKVNYDTAKEAISEVEILLTEGGQSISVGCMQINLEKHPTAFSSLKEAFNPNENVKYVAKTLLKLRKSSHSWLATIKKYYVKNSNITNLLQNSLLPIKIENRVKQYDTIIKQNTNSTQNVAYENEFDYLKLQKLNKMFLKRREIRQRLTRDSISKSNNKLVPSWKNKSFQSRPSGVLKNNTKSIITARRAELELRRRKELASIGESTFQQKRIEQLNLWKKKKIWKTP